MAVWLRERLNNLPWGFLNMRRNSYLAIGAALCLGAVVVAAGPQDKASRPSPPAKAECKLSGGKTVTVDYSSPRAKGRKIFGGIVPFDKVWRAGANEATTFVTDGDVSVGGTAVPAGRYTLFAIPQASKWTLIISKTTGEWGTAYSGPAADLARIDMKVSKLPAPEENFTIAFDQGGGESSCTMRMDWETTRASVNVATK